MGDGPSCTRERTVAGSCTSEEGNRRRCESCFFCTRTLLLRRSKRKHSILHHRRDELRSCTTQLLLRKRKRFPRRGAVLPVFSYRLVDEIVEQSLGLHKT